MVTVLGSESIRLVGFYKCDYSFTFINNNKISYSLGFLKKHYHRENIKPILVNHLINSIFKEDNSKTRLSMGSSLMKYEN